MQLLAPPFSPGIFAAIFFHLAVLEPRGYSPTSSASLPSSSAVHPKLLRVELDAEAKVSSAKFATGLADLPLVRRGGPAAATGAGRALASLLK